VISALAFKIPLWSRPPECARDGITLTSIDTIQEMLF
jgi:hypothetical protein